MEKDFSYFKKRKTTYEFLTIIFGGLAGINIILLFTAFQLNKAENIFLYVFLFFIGFLGVVYIRYQFKNISIEFKEMFVEDELHKIFPNSLYNSNKGFSKNEIKNSKVLKLYDRFSSEDLITGKFEDVKFRSSDITIKDVRQSGKSTTVVTMFQGRVYEFAFNKRFKSNLLLLQPGKFRLFGPWKKIKMESVRFNSELKVYAENSHEAFYILTPHFMEKLLYLDNKYRDKINFSFIDNKLYISVDSRRDTFDIKIFGDLPENIIKDFLIEFEDMKEFIIKLKLDNKIFMLGDEY